LQRGSSSSPHEPGSQSAAAAGAAQAGSVASTAPAAAAAGEVAVHVGRVTPEKQQRTAQAGSGQGSPVVTQGPLTALRPPSSRRMHD
jgi:hypothetical protein